MQKRFASLAIVFFVSSAAFPAALLAQNDDDDGLARSHFETGASLYLEENYEGAATAFEESYRIRPVPVVLFNLAQSYRRLYRYDDAIEAYQRYLRAVDDLTPSRRAEIRSTVAELTRGLAAVTIETDVPGAEIQVDGRSLGETPLSGPVQLAAGTRRLVATRDGHVTHRSELRVVGGRAQTVELSLPLVVAAARLRISASVEGAIVRIDGSDIGPPPITRQLGQGGHQVEVRADGYDTYRSEIVLAPRQDRELFADLTQSGALYEQWWFWATIGGVVAVAMIVGIAASASGPADPVAGTLGTVMALEAP